MYDLLLTRYHDMQFIMSLDLETGIGLIQKAFYKREEDKAFQLYASIYPNFTKNNFKKFSDFFKAQTGPISTRPADEILAEAEEILKKAGEKRGTV